MALEWRLLGNGGNSVMVIKKEEKLDGAYAVTGKEPLNII